MIIRYYKNENLTYTSRKRYANIPTNNFFAEEQKSVLLGDGATTSIKTIADNICDYVTIDNTRWFVTSYRYMNGKQVEMFLQRDVIGEFGLHNCYGKIERGYTETLLRNRKELGLNQILKKRQNLIPNISKYLNYSVDNHNGELWGIVYLSKPKENTSYNINIPSFSPPIAELELLNPSEYRESATSISKYIIYIRAVNINKFGEEVGTFHYRAYVSMKRTSNGDFHFDNVISRTGYLEHYQSLIKAYSGAYAYSEEEMYSVISDYINKVNSRIIMNTTAIVPVPEYEFPTDFSGGYVPYEYDNVNIKESSSNNIYNYTLSKEERIYYGSYPSEDKIYTDNFLSGNSYSAGNISYEILDGTSAGNLIFEIAQNIVVYTLNRRLLSNEEAGTLNFSIPTSVIDEPYSVLVFPLYNVTISGAKTYTINKQNAFAIFNEFVSYLSGNNSYLVDAQIYPYCPKLSSVYVEFKGYPFFIPASNTYEIDCSINLNPYSDVKKEYISRQYSIVSPEKSDKFNFNFYDYKKTINDVNGINSESLLIRIKTALKPFCIISSAVIIPEEGTLENMTYDSSLIGCQPSSNGFECSLSTDKFQEYVRNNSNYEKIFNKNQQYLQKQHQVEKANDVTSAIVNTMTATSMG